MDDYEEVIVAAAAGKKLWNIKHPENTAKFRQEEMALGLYLFMVKAIRTRWYSLIDRLQYGLDTGFEYYMKELDTAVETASFARLRNLYEFRNTPEEEVIRNGDAANLLEAAVWSIITTTTLQQTMLKAAGLKGADTDRIVTLAGTLAVMYYGAADISPEWRNEGLARELRKPFPDDPPYI